MCDISNEYIIGVDSYDFRTKSSAICVVNKTSQIVVYIKGGFSEEEFNKELERVCKYYSVPSHEVIREDKTKIRTNEVY